MLFRCLVALLLLAALPAGKTQSVVVASQNFAGFSTTEFLRLATLAGLNDTLASSNSVTLFIPTDQGFKFYPSQFLKNLEKPEFLPILRQIIAYHVVPGSYPVANFRDGELTTESNFRRIKVTSATSTYLPFVNDAQIISGDASASNGVVHLINRLLVPADLAPKGIFSLFEESGVYTNTKTFFAAIRAAGLVSSITTSTQKTLLIPTDAAFNKLPKGLVANLLMSQNKQSLAFLLNNHIVPGSAVWSSSAPPKLVNAAGRILMTTATGLNNTYPDGTNGNSFNITNFDIFALNGAIHLLDDVLVPPELVPTDVPSTIPTIPGLKTFFSTLAATGNLPIVLKNAASYTVFAPSDAAFEKLPAGYLAGLLVNNVVTLRNLMSAHLVRNSAILNSELKNGMVLNTDAPGVTITISQLPNGDFLLNGNVRIHTVSMGSMMVGDVVTTNGIIHVIDTVLIPPALVPVDTVSLLKKNSGFSEFSSLIDLTTLKYGPIFSNRLFPHTVFAPTNAAFAQLPKGYLNWIRRPANRGKLDAIVLYHFVRGIYFTNNLGNQTVVTVGNREKFSLLRTAGNGILPKIELNPYDELTFNSAIVDDLHSDNVAANGLVHSISKVLCPPSASPVNLYSMLLSLGLTDFANFVRASVKFTDFTKPGRNQFVVFAPRNGLLNENVFDFGNIDDYIFAGEFSQNTPVVTLNMVSTAAVNFTTVGNQNFFGGIRILDSDVPATNGLINVLDGRLFL